MGLFNSKLAKTETLIGTAADQRTPEQLQAAQQELDQMNAGFLLVPKTEAITSVAQLEEQITSAKTAQSAAETKATGLETELTTEKGKTSALETQLAEANNEIAKMKGDPADDGQASGAIGKKGDADPAAKTLADEVANLPFNVAAREAMAAREGR